jgi:hypothetical protein
MEFQMQEGDIPKIVGLEKTSPDSKITGDKK